MEEQTIQCLVHSPTGYVALPVEYSEDKRLTDRDAWLAEQPVGYVGHVDLFIS